MLFEKPAREQLLTESDVEQKFVYPFLIADPPGGLGFGKVTILTKHNIRRFSIDKGKQQKSYFPDYMVVIAGFPLLVIEAKKPNEDLQNAYREARLYAAELNAVYPSKLNPVSRILVTDGLKFLAGHADTNEPAVRLEYDDFDVYSQGFSNLHELLRIETLEAEFVRLSKLTKATRLFKPRKMVGGLSIQNEEVGHNTFGATISAEFSSIFNPLTREDRINVVKNAYVTSKRRTRYVEPIDRVVRASMSPSESQSTTIDDTKKPVEVIAPLRKGRQMEHQVLLIVGSVGVGKSTFIDYLQEVALPEDVRSRTVWVHMNMNVAPVSRENIYDWLRSEIVAGCQSAYQGVDFDDLDTMMAVYSSEISKFNKGIGKLLKSNKKEYNSQLASKLAELEANLHQKAVCHSRYCATERNKLLILVLDNSDKRTRDEQLLMFEAAQWLQKEFRALVVLPLREETYDNHRDQPPLDTALKDLVFRIEPPLFHSVLVRRVQMALNRIGSGKSKSHRFDTPNGFHVEYSASDQAYFLSSIMRSIFEYDYQVRRLIVGLSGKSLRRALEIFLEFCNSGYISEGIILQIIKSEGKHVLPLELVVTVLVRMNRRFYDSDRSFLKNVFAADAKDERPQYFTRLIVLNWLLEKWNKVGPSGLKGYFSVRDLMSDLELLGVDRRAAHREIEYLAEGRCLSSEDLRVNNLGEDDLIRLAPAGFVHLDLLSNVNYLAAIAEDTWFLDRDLATAIKERIITIEDQASKKSVILNAEALLKHLTEQKALLEKIAASMVEANNASRLTNLEPASRAISNLRKNIGADAWFDVEVRFPKGSNAKAIIVNRVSNLGIFAELEPGVVGLIHKSRLPGGFATDDSFSEAEVIEVGVYEIHSAQKRINLDFVRTLEPQLDL
jgi:hypothetical protein